MSVSDQLLTRMLQQADTWENQGDKRFIFLRCYYLMTSNMVKAIRGERFSDCNWVEKLLTRFAEYYFNALNLYDLDPARAPAIWKHAHDASRSLPLNVLQHLLLGINAHINYDLVLALYDGLHEEWPSLSGTQRSLREADHHQVNRIIGETIDAVQDSVIETQSALMAVLDLLMGPVDEWLLSRLITTWRTEVWLTTLNLLEAFSAEDREAIRIKLEAEALIRAENMLLVPINLPRV